MTSRPALATGTLLHWVIILLHLYLMFRSGQPGLAVYTGLASLLVGGATLVMYLVNVTRRDPPPSNRTVWIIWLVVVPPVTQVVYLVRTRRRPQ